MEDSLRARANKAVLQDDGDKQYRQIWCAGYCQGAKEQYDIDRNNAICGFNSFIEYLHESGRINLDEIENSGSWKDVFVTFFDNANENKIY